MHFPLQEPVLCLQEKIAFPLLIEVADCILDDLVLFERLQSCHGHVASPEIILSIVESRTQYLNKNENRKTRRRKAEEKGEMQPAVRDYGPSIFLLLISKEEVEKGTEGYKSCI